MIVPGNPVTLDAEEGARILRRFGGTILSENARQSLRDALAAHDAGSRVQKHMEFQNKRRARLAAKICDQERNGIKRLPCRTCKRLQIVIKPRNNFNPQGHVCPEGDREF